jgi:PhnB protein
MASASPVPQGMHTVTPNLLFRDCAKAIEFYQKVFGAQEIARFPAPDGSSIWHSELRIGDSVLYLNDTMPGMPASAPTPEAPSPISLWLYLEDCDAAFHRAVGAGAKAMMPPADMFWGDRVAGVADPYGYLWNFATRKKELSPEEMRRGAEEFARSMAAKR